MNSDLAYGKGFNKIENVRASFNYKDFGNYNIYNSKLKQWINEYHYLINLDFNYQILLIIKINMDF